MNAGVFLKLRDVLVWPPLMPAISVTFLLGLHAVVCAIFKACGARAPARSAVACGYVVGLGAVAGAVHLLAEMDLASLPLLRAIGYAFCACGLLALPARWQSGRDAARRLVRTLRTAAPWERLDFGLMTITLAALALCAFAPVTDADSLDYHLGVPLDMLRQGGFHPSPVWLHSRLIGLGEYVNLLGLAMGTDNLGAVLSLSALIWIVLLLAPVSGQAATQRLVLKLLLGLPVLLFLVPSQKPQLIGSLALVAAYLCPLEHPHSRKALVLGIGAALFACGLKTSFYLSAGVVLLALWLPYRREPRTALLLFPAGVALAYALMVFPIHLANALHFHNPLSPFYSGLFGDVTPGLAAGFVRFLRDYSEGFGFPCNLLLPNAPGAVSTALGLGILAACFVRRHTARGRQCLWMAAGMAVAVALACQRTSRFFTDAYLFSVLAVASSQELRSACGRYARALTLQLALVAALAGWGAVTLFPGSLSWRERDRVMTRAAFGYAAMQALDRALPASCLLFCDLRSQALIPRPFVPQDYAACLALRDFAVMRDVLASAPTSAWYVAASSALPTNAHPLQAFVRATLVDGALYPAGTRNPFNRARQPLYVYEVDAAALQQSLRQDR